MTELDFLEARRCAVCGKDFAVLYPHLWRYKEPCGGKGHYRYFCSWKCLRANEKNQKEKTDMEKLKKDGTPAKKPGPKPKTGTLEEAMSGMADAAADFFEKCGDMGLEVGAMEPVRKVTKPLAHSGMEACGWRGTIGRFIYDEDHDIIDFEGVGGDDLSFTTDAWRIFMRELRTAAELMGVEL